MKSLALQIALNTEDRERLIEILCIVFGLPALFLFVNFIHFQYFPVHVILYACIVDAIISTAIFSAVYSIFRYARRKISIAELVLSLAVANLGILLYSIMGPTVIDRSLSIYIVEKLDARGGEIAADKLRDVFVQEYIPEFRLMDVRLTEQVRSGTVVLEGDCMRITPRGEALAGFMKFYRRTLLPQKRVLMGEVTDQLTNPFKGSTQIVDVRCSRADLAQR